MAAELAGSIGDIGQAADLALELADPAMWLAEKCMAYNRAILLVKHLEDSYGQDPMLVEYVLIIEASLDDFVLRRCFKMHAEACFQSQFKTLPKGFKPAEQDLLKAASKLLADGTVNQVTGAAKALSGAGNAVVGAIKGVAGFLGKFL